MFITQEQLNQLLDNYFTMTDAHIFNQQYFDHSLQLILDNHHDLYDRMRDSDYAPIALVFEAFRRFAQEACDDEFGYAEGIGYQMLSKWLWTHTQDAYLLVKNTENYINNERAEAQKEKEENTMKNTEKNSIETIELTEDTERLCAECGCVIEGEGHEVDGEWYCDDCFEQQFAVCPECGEIVRKDDDYYYEGEWYCEDCWNEYFAVCERCGEIEPKEEMTWIEDEECYVCDICRARFYSRCERCDEWVRDGYINTVYTDSRRRYSESWCDDCADEYSWICDECGDRYSEDVPDDGNCTCPECSGGGRDTGDINTWKSPRRRMPYGYKPTPCFCATSAERQAAGSDWERKIVFFGFELEVDREEKCYEENEWSERIVDELPSTYCKTDCSLDHGGDYSGIEIVSHPATLAWYMERKDEFLRCFDMLKDGGWLSHDAKTCGLHIHISLHALEEQNPFAVHNMLILYDRFWDKLVKFSRRTKRQLDHWAKKYSTAHGTYAMIKDMAKRERDRYMAVNLMNSHTVEIRMFRGTLNPETFFATLQLVDTITKKCIEIGNDAPRVQSITWNEMVASDYTELNSYLERRGLMNVEEEPAPVAEEPVPEEPQEHRPLTLDEVVLGDRVRCITAPDHNSELVGHEGVVRVISRYSRLGIGVDFADDMPKESCGLHCMERIHTPTGWWCEVDSLELISHPDVPGAASLDDLDPLFD